MRLLCISNGHGEDLIAVRILQAVQGLLPHLEMAALPIVGEGWQYQKAGIEIIGPTKQMPSGGFIYMDSQQLARDLQGGLLQLTVAQLRAMGQWLRTDDVVLAVGDIVPLLFGWLSRCAYGFVGTAKSEYYVRDEQGNCLDRSTLLDVLDFQRTCVYMPWERWLMRRSACVFPRDGITTRRLQQWAVEAYDAGNPMMDGFLIPPAHGATDPERLTVLLLPGSRAPEAYENWQRLLVGVDDINRHLSQPVTFLAAITASLELAQLTTILMAHGWQADGPPDGPLGGQNYRQGENTLSMAAGAFMDYTQRATVAIATAGTATEQFVGLGKPVITLPGNGPQFTHSFAQAQARHLGPSVTLVSHPHQVAETVRSILGNPERQAAIYKNGRHRMGPPGASQRIAEILAKTLLAKCLS
ncbi:lipid-A-disaccharide synthase-related protein [Leptothoe sp. PORK10 BA2]|uniref:lipid-A-disaccharide synthase-related protein n=1 Tax=Leptothoe sp. PORK10 BA2 TaxID=3110254 RepID=UPI002B1F9EEF|nr:lipid-A-disaccharide synthase-related protein [Leptothoe sp. PORK10 BA2]MEA5463703.1 lipid-A-disaccharide synthase-related protein [Leptothoe sp. PORK10 BA2]